MIKDTRKSEEEKMSMDETKEEKKKKVPKETVMLVLLCWLVYTVSYLGKVNYSAVKAQVMDYYSVLEGDTGLVGTFMFFSYAVGQIINGLFCKKYNLKWIIFISLLLSSLVNFCVGLAENFTLLKYLWLVNGCALSILWPCLIRLLSETISKKNMPFASIGMGTTVAAGTLVIYGLSAIFVKINFKLSFFFPAVTMAITAFIWFCFYSKTVSKALLAEKEFDSEEFVLGATEESEKVSGKEKQFLFLTIGLLPIYAIATNLIKDGLTSWMPKILMDSYTGIDSSISIILSLLLPIVAMFGNLFAVNVHKKIPDFIYHCVFIYLTTGIFIGMVIGFLPTRQLIITLIGFSISCFLVSSCNSVITSIFPLFMKGKINSGLMAGLLNAFCYLGSMLSEYGLGILKERTSWLVVFWVLFAFCVLCCVVGGVYWFIKRRIAKKKD